MKYILLFEKYSGRNNEFMDNKLLFNILPQSVDYRIYEFMINNYKRGFVKSPYGHSYYSGEVDWDYKEDNSYRVADHWNFTTKKDNKTHCETTTSVKDNSHWSIGIFREELGKYEILDSYPKVPNKDKYKNREKMKEIRNDFFDRPSDINKKVLVNKFLYNILSEVTLKIDGKEVPYKVTNVGRSKIKYTHEGEDNTIPRSKLKKHSVEGYYKGIRVFYNIKGSVRLTNDLIKLLSSHS